MAKQHMDNGLRFFLGSVVGFVIMFCGCLAYIWYAMDPTENEENLQWHRHEEEQEALYKKRQFDNYHLPIENVRPMAPLEPLKKKPDFP